jgi:hypothetical protein
VYQNSIINKWGVSMSKEKAEEILKDILKPLYFKIDKKWTIEDDNRVSNLIEEIEDVDNRS